MKKVVIGYIFGRKEFDKEEKIFLKLAKKKNIKLIMFNLSEEIDEKEFQEKAKECDLIFNNTAGDLAVELSKTFEELGKKVIEHSEVYYYIEDKWIFFLKCKEHKIPTPETILLSNNLNSAKRELKKFGQWPVVLKKVEEEQGEFVKKADSVKEAVKIIKEFWGNERYPIIAQEFIKSYSYRVTVIGNKIVQTALENGHGWKATAVYAKKVDKFKIDEDLEKLVKKIVKVCKLNICGIDFFKKNGKWIVLDINAEPCFQFFENEREKIVGQVLDFLKIKARNS